MDEIYTKIILVIIIGIMIIGVNLLYINAVFACKVETTGTFIKYNTVHGGRGTTYEPVFRYYIKGEEFQGRCLNELSLSKIQKRFVVGQTYTIYVNEKKPDFFVIYRKASIRSIYGVLTGIGFLLVVGIYFIVC